jgi:hypothetical protein
MSERLTALAEKYGVALHYQDARGMTVSTDLHVVATLLQKMGVLSDNREERDKLADEMVLPPVLVVRPHNGTVAVELLNAPEQRQNAWTLRLESGEVRHGVAGSIRKSSRGGKVTRSLVLPSIASAIITWSCRN